MGKLKNKSNKNLSDRVKEKPKKPTNPFEVHVNRQKFSVIGRTLKHDKGLPGIARSKAFTKRKATLLREYQLKNKSNKFLDRRIGEKSKYMSSEDRVTARFTAERIKAHKKSKYNLADEEILTHRGHALSEIEKFDDPKSDDEGDDRGKLESKFVAEAHFGGFLTKKEETETQAKSRKELIDQLISESKKRRYEKQKMQDETLELTDKLDTQWKDLLPLVSLGNSETASDEKKTHVLKPDTPKERPKVDPYDLAVQELKFEARGKPSEKLKTEEEIAMEEKEKLEKLEMERQRRMHGFLNENPQKHRSADDLDDGFVLESDIEDVGDAESEKHKAEAEDMSHEDGRSEDGDSEDGGSGNEEEGYKGGGGSGKDEEGGGSEEGHSEDDFSDLILESSDEENEKGGMQVDGRMSEKGSSIQHNEGNKLQNSSKKLRKDSKEEKEDIMEYGCEPETVKMIKLVNLDPSNANDGFSEMENKVRRELLKRKAIMEKARKELPYTFSVPNTYDDFLGLMKDLSPEHQSVVIERMIKCTHPSLKSGNKQLLETLFVYIMQHINDCPQAFQQSSFKEFKSESTYCFAVMRNIMSNIYDLAQSSPENAACCMAEVIKEKFEEVEKEFPGLDTLLFLKIIPEVFPTSDFRHPVSTPSLILMTHALRCCQVRSRQDVATGLFISALLHEYSSLSKRFSPEAVNFLHGVIYLAIPKATGLPDPPRPSMYKNICDDSANLLVITKNPFMNSEPLNLVLEAEDLDESSSKNDSSFSVRALCVAVQLTVSWINQLKDLPSRKDLFYPFISLISLLPVSAYPQCLVNSVKVLEDTLKYMVENSGPVEKLTHAAKKPKPLRLYEPAIEEVFDGRRRRTVSKEKAEHEKLLHKYKKEMKGAIREIRRDKDFLAKVKVKETLRNDMQRMEKVKEIFGAAALQQGELQKLKRKK